MLGTLLAKVVGTQNERGTQFGASLTMPSPCCPPIFQDIC